MKLLLFFLVSGFLLVSCSKKSDEPVLVIVPTNALVGTTWVRHINPNFNAYLSFKNADEVEFSTKDSSNILTVPANIYKYSFKSEKMVFRANGYNYTGTISAETMTVIGTAGDLIYLKIK